ncbi:GEMI7 protein, partial [Origma solitaria]|nr:GEMI7 protein [Origma solitaria]
MAEALPLPVGVLRLPRAPDPSGSRGFSGDNSRRSSRDSPELQSARAALRERFLRLLSSARGRPARFRLWSGTEVHAVFGAADVEAVAIQVDSLRTPLGVQSAALLRCSDVLAFSFPL